MHWKFPNRDTHYYIDCVLVAQSCLTLCNPMNWSLPDSSVHGIFQAKYWSGLPFPSPGDLPDPGFKPTCAASADGFFTTKPPGKPSFICSPTYLLLSYQLKCDFCRRWTFVWLIHSCIFRSSPLSGYSNPQSRYIINVLNEEMNFYCLGTVILNNSAWVAFRAGIDHIYILVNGRYEGCFPSWRRKHIK